MSCPDCFKGEIMEEEPKGTITDLNGAYLAAAPHAAIGTTSRAVVLFTDIFGLRVPNPKVLADLFSAQLECDVWVPDYFAGRPPANPEKMIIPEHAGDNFSVWKWITVFLNLIPTIPALIRQRPTVTDARNREFLAKLKAHKSYDKIGAVGYCFGGSTAIRFAATDTFDSIVICHPGRTNVAAFKAIKVPCSWVCAEVDITFKKSLRLSAEAELAGRVGRDNFVEYEFKDYPGTAHGFAARPVFKHPGIKEAFEASVKQTVEWFQKTLVL